jgi:hypothetical protein
VSKATPSPITATFPFTQTRGIAALSCEDGRVSRCYIPRCLISSNKHRKRFGEGAILERDKEVDKHRGNWRAQSGVPGRGEETAYADEDAGETCVY